MRRRGIGQPLQVAEDDGCAKPLGQTVDLLVEDLPIGVVLRREIAFGGPLRDALVERVPTRRRSAYRESPPAARPRTASSRPIRAPADGPGPVGQDEEDGLKGILRVVRVARTPRQTRSTIGPCRITSSSKAASAASSRRDDESVQELRIGHRPDRSEVEQPVHLPVHPVGWAARHSCRSPRLLVSSE